MRKDKMLKILEELRFHGIENIDDYLPFPKPFIGKGPIKAIVLGADPSTKDKIRFDTVFDLSGEDKRYFAGIERNLHAIGLTLDNIYVQNLCQNYFKHTTYTNKKNWWRAASIWQVLFRQEVQKKFDENVAILATSEIILRRLIYPNPKTPQEYYSNPDNLPECAELYVPERGIFPFYRHWRYNFERPEWEGYRTKLTHYFFAL